MGARKVIIYYKGTKGGKYTVFSMRVKKKKELDYISTVEIRGFRDVPFGGERVKGEECAHKHRSTVPRRQRLYTV